MSLTDILMILSTAVSPLIAVQVTKYLDDRNEKRERKFNIFKILMATRAYNLSPSHVEALNRIDLEFSAKVTSEKAVLDVWMQYLDHLGNRNMEPQLWGSKRIDLLVDLLMEMGKCLNYEFNKTQIKNGTYAPIAHGITEAEQERVRKLIIELLEGSRAIPMCIHPNIKENQPSY